jgi:hypothetical protein
VFGQGPLDGLGIVRGDRREDPPAAGGALEALPTQRATTTREGGRRNRVSLRSVVVVIGLDIHDETAAGLLPFRAIPTAPERRADR